MTASYVLVTFAAVLLVEGLAAALVIPNVNEEANLSSRVVNTANQLAGDYGGVLIKSYAQAQHTAAGDTNPKAFEHEMAKLAIKDCGSTGLGEPGATLAPGQEKDLDNGVLIPLVRGSVPATAPMSLALLLGLDGTILCSSFPSGFTPGDTVGKRLPAAWLKGAANVSQLSGGKVAWASIPITDTASEPSPKVATASPAPTKDRLGVSLGFMYVQAPVPSVSVTWADLAPLIRSGAIFLLATIPVGVAFGTLTTRAMVGRLRRLATGTVGFAGGDFAHRVPESSNDEVGQLERHFNQMADHLQVSIAEQRALAEKNARLAERSRISRELHDSISQDLFSISALVGGLRRALPADSTVQPQLETLSRTVTSTIRETRALLLELRPTALETKGLAPALRELCEAYEARAGLRVQADIEPVALGPAGELAAFRIAQEGLSNAARHSEAEAVRVALCASDGHAELTVADDGHGFDPGAINGHGLGLKLMAERVRELGGELDVESAVGQGAVLRVRLPL